VQTEQPIAALAISRDGDRLAYVAGPTKDGSKGRADLSFVLQSTTSRSSSVTVPLKPGEQISGPSF
jgi:hypothetical protein